MLTDDEKKVILDLMANNKALRVEVERLREIAEDKMNKDARKQDTPPVYGIWFDDNGDGVGCWMLLACEDLAGSMDMPHTFFSRSDADKWLQANPQHADGVVRAMNKEASYQDAINLPGR